ncbi:SusD/RagB family nutrient-binding outer membrane lipoprotein [Chitinophaga rhizophila]|uniref:SusD/RagB family nutrient-binding outer membrane lipoprotein n=1 Tax=Chitinophaga rhizophila TaxID=2866212 RepID=A0ABS7GDS3_9BACT|nr:SusD/RagB family nutrient-binding outer membrane lipoprotein [Chitinophaga rhizophila]MBW8685823.1 SusD/RagB family nutrient-binding outer membrane lipoprotein [Chitinophaga rhizophila]
MKKSIIRSTAGMLAVVALSLAGCSKYLDINDDPTKVDDLDPAYLLPSAQAATAMVVGGSFQITGGIWAQYWTQGVSNSQYTTTDQYNVQATDFDRPWLISYAGALQDLQVIVNNANSTRLAQYAAIAELLKAYQFQVLTDAFGDVPVADAVKAFSDNVIAPKYDAQKVVYDSIFAMIDRGLENIDPASTAGPGEDDLIFGGDMNKWIAFGNTLKLRAYMRLSEIDPTRASNGIAALSGASFLTEDAKIDYVAAGGNNNPLYAEILGLNFTQNLVASKTATDQMNAAGDPRVSVFYKPDTDTTGITGIPQGSFRIKWTYNFSIPSSVVGASAREAASATAPVKFMSAAESYFLQAEAAARGWLPGANARNLYQAGITASFEAYDVAPGTFITNTVAAFPATEEAQIQAIITQKYFAMCGNQNFEAWTEWRRTGYPSFFVQSVSSVLGAGQWPVRFLYPNQEVTRNPSFPGAKLVTEKMWWDAN